MKDSNSRPFPESLPSTGFVRISAIIAPHGPIPVSRSTWWNGVRTGRFPKPVKLSERITAWCVQDIRRLIERNATRVDTVFSPVIAPPPSASSGFSIGARSSIRHAVNLDPTFAGCERQKRNRGLGPGALLVWVLASIVISIVVSIVISIIVSIVLVLVSVLIVVPVVVLIAVVSTVASVVVPIVLVLTVVLVVVLAPTATNNVDVSHGN